MRFRGTLIEQGTDIRHYGSKNAGLTNTVRILGIKRAWPVIIVDLGKGFLAPFIAGLFAMRFSPEWTWLPLVAGFLAILGHSFTCMAGFRGGKGVLTALGVFLYLCPVTALSSFLVWILLTALTKYVSVGSIGACTALIALSVMGFLGAPYPVYDTIDLPLLLTCCLVGVFVIVKHRANIVRLLNGTENGFGKKRKK